MIPVAQAKSTNDNNTKEKPTVPSIPILSSRNPGIKPTCAVTSAAPARTGGSKHPYHEVDGTALPAVNSLPTSPPHVKEVLEHKNPKNLEGVSAFENCVRYEVNNIHIPLHGSGVSTTSTGTSAPPGTPPFKAGSAGDLSVTTTMSGISLPSAIMLEARAFNSGSGEPGPLPSLGVGWSATKDTATSVGVAASSLDLL